MPNAAGPDARGWLIPAGLGIAAITVLRIVLLAFNRTDLFVDEAQYWLWGQHLAFGYYSKPPMIGWVIRAATDLAGSDAAFWVRLPGPLLHGATALLLGGLAARLHGARVALVTALAYATLPMVALGSLLISTDTIMFPFLAGALWAWIVVLDRGGTGPALLAGALLGLAFLSKYAAVYYLLCAALAALLLPAARPGRRAAALALAAFVVVISPNLVWNLANGLTTVEHTLDNADWVRDPGARAALNLAGLAEFLAAQFAVIGPVLFAALLVMAVRWRRLSARDRLFLLFTLPILALVCAQALLSRAYANWAAAAYLAGLLAVVPWLMSARRVWLVASFAINGTLALALPLATLAADTLRLGGPHLALERYVGRAEMSRAILAAADARGLSTIVAGDRDVLSDLFHTGRAHPAAVYALPPRGRPEHHYAQNFPFSGAEGPVLLVLRDGTPVPCPETAQDAGRIAPSEGAYRRHPQQLYVVPGDCLAGQAGSA